MTPIPTLILNAADSLLKDYGVSVSELLKRGEKAPTLKPIEKEWLSTEEAMHFSGLSRCTLWRAAKAGKITARKLSQQKQGRLLFARASLENWIQHQQSVEARAGE